MPRTGTSTFRVLGVDPGLNITGYAVVEYHGRDARIIEAGAIRPPAKFELTDRIARIHADLAELITECKPTVVAVEQLYAHYKHPRTAILMAHARGAVLLAAAQAHLAVKSVSATEVKKALTGNGHASKHQVQRAIQSICGLGQPPEPPDVADALAIAICAGRRL